MSETRVDIIVIGAGIAGVSAAASCSSDARVALLETESHPGTHATGRSAAYFAPSYGNEVIRAISAAGESFFRQPPQEYFPQAILKPRANVYIARDEQMQSLDTMASEIASLDPLPLEQLKSQVSLLKAEALAAALVDTSGGDLDVDALMSGYLRLLKARGGQLFTGSRVESLRYAGGLWHVYCGDVLFSAPKVVNAAGAWSDSVAELAGLGGLQITPMRRTALLVDVPGELDISGWPLVVDVDEEFYFKPDAGQLLLSPADETACVPGDAHPEELDIAIAVDRVSRVLDLEVRRVNHAWAGLRSFAPDRGFVLGEDSRARGFFWLAGQGGYGVQAAPGLSAMAANLLVGASFAAEFQGLADYLEEISPTRFLESRAL